MGCGLHHLIETLQLPLGMEELVNGAAPIAAKIASAPALSPTLAFSIPISGSIAPVPTTIAHHVATVPVSRVSLQIMKKF